jgi:hypothetical protein
MIVHMTSPDFTYERVNLTIWTVAEPAVSIIAISIPVLYVQTRVQRQIVMLKLSRRMLYRELRSSDKSGSTSTSKINNNNNNNRHANGRAKQRSSFRRSLRYTPDGRYGQSTTVVMSTSGWRESEEALHDSIHAMSSYSLPQHVGVMKTEEVRVDYESSTPMDGPIELEVMPASKN